MLSPTVSSFVADLITIAHGIICIFFSSYIIFSACLKRKLPNYYLFFIAIMSFIAILGYIFIGDCLINPIEHHFRQLANQDVYNGSFIAHYLQKTANLNLSMMVVKTIDVTTGLMLGLIFFNVITKKHKSN